MNHFNHIHIYMYFSKNNSYFKWIYINVCESCLKYINNDNQYITTKWKIKNLQKLTCILQNTPFYHSQILAMRINFMETNGLSMIFVSTLSMF